MNTRFFARYFIDYIFTNCKKLVKMGSFVEQLQYLKIIYSSELLLPQWFRCVQKMTSVKDAFHLQNVKCRLCVAFNRYSAPQVDRGQERKKRIPLMWTGWNYSQCASLQQSIIMDVSIDPHTFPSPSESLSASTWLLHRYLRLQVFWRLLMPPSGQWEELV